MPQKGMVRQARDLKAIYEEIASASVSMVFEPGHA